MSDVTNEAILVEALLIYEDLILEALCDAGLEYEDALRHYRRYDWPVYDQEVQVVLSQYHIDDENIH